MKLLPAALLLCCLSGAALGLVTPPDQAVLNALTVQTQLAAVPSETNPSGLALISYSTGSLKRGNFLATSWNSPEGAPGQGRTILQVTPQGNVSTFATIDPNNAIIRSNCGSSGVGLTAVLVTLSGGNVIVGSTPIAPGATTADPGCLILLDSSGTVLDARAALETTSSGTSTRGGPWAMAIGYGGLFVSYVLGTNSSSTTTLSGADGGMVVRYSLQFLASRLDGPPPDVVASGFPTTPGGIAAGTVGPAGLMLGYTTGSTFDAQLNDTLFIANTLNNSIVSVAQPGSCYTLPGAPPQCVQSTVAWRGQLDGPTGIAQSPLGTIVGANSGSGILFEVAPTAGTNKQLAVQLVDDTDDSPDAAAGAGNLCNVLFLDSQTLVFNDKYSNAFYTLRNPAPPPSPPLSPPPLSPPSYPAPPPSPSP